MIRDLCEREGHGPGSRICFLDHIPGPCELTLLPDEKEPRYDEREAYKKVEPEVDWDTVFAAQENQSDGLVEVLA